MERGPDASSVAWDGQGKPRQTTTPAGVTTTRGYDLDGRVLVERTTRAAGTESTTYTYTSGRLTAITHPGGGSRPSPTSTTTPSRRT